MHHANVICGIAGLLVVTLGAPVATGQSLADVARREEDRRKAIASPSRVYTNETLRSDHAVVPAPSTAAASPGSPATATSPPTAPPSPGGTAAGAPGSPGAGAASVTAPAKEDGAKRGESYWRQRIQQSRDGQQRAEVVAAALQSRINALSTDVISRDDPAQRSVLAADRDKALQELERVKKEIQQHAKAVVDAQEEARRSGIPPGWVR